MQLFLLLLRSYLCFCVAMLSNLLLLVFVIGAILYGIFFLLQICCLINIWQSYVLSVSICSGVAFQTAHRILSLKN
jgi:hypothetical protein